MKTQQLFLSAILLFVLIIKLFCSDYSYWSFVKTFIVKSEHEIEEGRDGSKDVSNSLSLTDLDDKTQCNMISDRVWNEQYNACMKTCAPGFVFDPEKNICACPDDSVNVNGTCRPLCLPSKRQFENKDLKYYDDITRTCRNAYDVDPRCHKDKPYFDGEKCVDTTMRTMNNMFINSDEYTFIGKGDHNQCLSNKECDGVINESMIKFKKSTHMYNKVMNENVQFKISTL